MNQAPPREGGGSVNMKELETLPAIASPSAYCALRDFIKKRSRAVTTSSKG